MTDTSHHFFSSDLLKCLVESLKSFLNLTRLYRNVFVLLQFDDDRTPQSHFSAGPELVETVCVFDSVKTHKLKLLLCETSSSL